MKFCLPCLAFCVTLLPWLLAAPVSAAPPVVTAAPPAVAVTDLGTLGGSGSTGFGVNNKGQVAGTSRLPGDKAVHAFFYTDGKMRDMGTLGGAQSEAHALNEAGQVTGNSDIKGPEKRHAFLWQQGQMSDLGTSRADDSDGLAINGAGQVAGRIIRGRIAIARACLWVRGKADVLDESNTGSSVINGINSAGQLAGTFQEPGQRFTKSSVFGLYFTDHALLWGKSKISELGVPGTEVSLATAINDRSQVAGAATFGKDPVLHACLWQSAGVMVGGTNPEDLTENGKKLGDADKTHYAFCCSGTRLINLNSLIDPASGWMLMEARGISDTGFVTGTGAYKGQSHAFLLKLPPVF